MRRITAAQNNTSKKIIRGVVVRSDLLAKRILEPAPADDNRLTTSFALRRPAGRRAAFVAVVGGADGRD